MVQVFPSRRSLIRMLGAVFSETDEDWEAEVVLRGVDSPGAGLGRAPRPPGIRGAPPRSTRGIIIDVVLADNPIGRRAA